MSRRDPSGNMLEIVCSNLHLHLIAYAFEGERITHLSHDYDTIFTFTFHDMATVIFCSPNYRDAHSSCPTRICCIKWRLLGKTLVHRYLSDWIEITSKLSLCQYANQKVIIARPTSNPRAIVDNRVRMTCSMWSSQHVLDAMWAERKNKICFDIISMCDSLIHRASVRNLDIFD